MRVEKIEVPASVQSGMKRELDYLFARADKGGAGWIGRLDAPKGETFGGIMFYSACGVVHTFALSETTKLWPICRWTCECPDGWEEMLAYMPPATAYCGRDVAYRIPPRDVGRWWVEQCLAIARRLREGMNAVPTYAEYRARVEKDKRDMLLRWRMGYDEPGWRLDWMVGAGMTPWDMVRRETTYPMEKDNPVGRRMMRVCAAYRLTHM